MKSIKVGTLVRFLQFDEYFEGEDCGMGHHDLQDETVEEVTKIWWHQDIAGIKAYPKLSTVKKLELNIEDDEKDDEQFDHLSIEVPFGTKALVIGLWEGKHQVWQRVLVEEKTVWTTSDNLVDLDP